MSSATKAKRSKFTVGDTMSWQENKDLPRELVTIVATDQPWITGGAKRPIAEGACLVRDDDGREFIAPPFTLHSLERVLQLTIASERTAKTVSATDAWAALPPLTEENLLHFQTGDPIRLDVSELDFLIGSKGTIKSMNPSETWIMLLLNSLGIRFRYEPRRFALTGAHKGPTSTSPDLHILDLDLYVELTVGEEWVAKKKRWRMHQMRIDHPGVGARLMQAEDFILLAAGELTRERVLDYLQNQTVFQQGPKRRAKVYQTTMLDPHVHPSKANRIALMAQELRVERATAAA